MSSNVFSGNAESLIVPGAQVGPLTGELLSYLGNSPSVQASEGTYSKNSSENGVPKKYGAGIESRETNELLAVEHSDEDEEMLERQEMMSRPFLKRPAPWWVLGTVFLVSIAMSATLAPKVELYTTLACQALKPELLAEDPARLQDWGNGVTVPPPSKACGNDPEVQAAVAGLITIMSVSSGILSCITTGWWGQLSDRYGRKRILGIATIGLLITDFNLILVSRDASRLPGGYRFLLVGPAFDGLLGGLTTLSAGLNAYSSDCTPADKRSHIFSLNVGMMFTGMILGPALGGLLVQSTKDLLSVFYLATASHVLWVLLIWLVLPESLPRTLMLRARKHRESVRSENTNSSRSAQGGFAVWVWTKSLINAMFGFLAPLGIFLPARRLQGTGRDWNLTLVVISFAIYSFMAGLYQFKLQYAQQAFGWNSEALGYWISAFSITSAIYLILILPLMIKFFKPKVGPIQLPVLPGDPLDSTRSPSEASSGRSSSLQRVAPKNVALFDLNLARISLVVEFACYVGMTLSNSPAAWTAASVLDAFGSGFLPAMQSVALALYEQGPNKGIETGRLFGGLGVVQSVSSQIIGPSIFGFTYLSTVDIFPMGIFVVAGAALAIALSCISLFRLVQGPINEGHDREETAVAQEGE